MIKYKDESGDLYEVTGEFRNPKKGEFFLYEGSNEVDQCCIEYSGNEWRIIVKEIKPESKQPTHEEIMTKWWLFNSRWLRVLEYWPINGGECHYLLKSEAFEDGCTWQYKQGFQGRESADIPPEDK